MLFFLSCQAVEWFELREYFSAMSYLSLVIREASFVYRLFPGVLSTQSPPNDVEHVDFLSGNTDSRS